MSTNSNNTSLKVHRVFSLLNDVEMDLDKDPDKQWYSAFMECLGTLKEGKGPLKESTPPKILFTRMLLSILLPTAYSLCRLVGLFSTKTRARLEGKVDKLYGKFLIPTIHLPVLYFILSGSSPKEAMALASLLNPSGIPLLAAVSNGVLDMEWLRKNIKPNNASGKTHEEMLIQIMNAVKTQVDLVYNTPIPSLYQRAFRGLIEVGLMYVKYHKDYLRDHGVSYPIQDFLEDILKEEDGSVGVSFHQYIHVLGVYCIRNKVPKTAMRSIIELMVIRSVYT